MKGKEDGRMGLPFVKGKKRKPVQFYVGNGNRFYRSNYLTDRAFEHDLRALKGKGVDVRVVYEDGTESARRAPRKKE